MSNGIIQTEIERHRVMECGDSSPLSRDETNNATESGNKFPHSKVGWPHAPTHRLSESGTYFVTAGTYRKQHFFKGTLRLDVLQRGLLSVCAEFGWRLEAWCVFPNHYHFVAHSPEGGADSLSPMLKKLHGNLAVWINKLDKTPGRKVWHNYWDTRMTYEKSYLARLRYTHANAVHHGLVPVANQYAWCSAAWFERTATPAQVKTIYGMKTDSVRVMDDFDMECGDSSPLSSCMMETGNEN
ncbi:MAG: transposase [Zoogloeaceae bacterium]|jgi:putative transposase|nr:transposase [Zoogloeaceae bacterium]